MRIGVDLLFLVPGQVGGTDPLFTNLLKSLTDSKHSFIIYALHGFSDANRQIARTCDVVEVPWSRGAQGLRIAAEHTWLNLDARRRNLDLVHFAVGTAPLLTSKPFVISIHDIQYLHHPENFHPVKRAWLRTSIPSALRRASGVAALSNWAKQDLVDKLDCDPDKIQIVPFGSQGLFGLSPVDALQTRMRFGLQRPFFFFPSRTYKHKNHELLIEAFRSVDKGVDLVLTGPPWSRDREVFEVIRKLSMSDRVRHLGMVKRGELAGLYSSAAALVYPSRFEGFGAPLLEAMSVGCPIIAANSTAIPEVVSGAGILESPDDPVAWAGHMERMLTDDLLRQRLVERGIARAAEFTWQRAAGSQIELYEASAA
jgi:glycosyltransferase involved in cell wall biosynthesis